MNESLNDADLRARRELGVGRVGRRGQIEEQVGGDAQELAAGLCCAAGVTITSVRFTAMVRRFGSATVLVALMRPGV